MSSAATAGRATARKPQAVSGWTHLRGLLPYLGRYRAPISLGLSTVVLMTLIGNVIPLAAGIITDALAGSAAPFEHGQAAGAHAAPAVTSLSRLIPFYAPYSHKTVWIYCLLMVLCVAIKGLLSFYSRWKLIGISRDIEYDVRSDLLDRLLMMEPEFYVRNRTGELMSRATNDLNSVRMVLGPGIMYSVTTICTMVFAIVVLLKLSSSLTVWVLLPVPVVALAVRHFGKIIHDL